MIITDPSDELFLLLRCAILRLLMQMLRLRHNQCVVAVLLPVRRSLVHRSVPDIDAARRIGRTLRKVAQSATHHLLFRHGVVDIGKDVAASSLGRASLVQSRLRTYRVLKRAIHVELLVLNVLLHGGWYGNFLVQHGSSYRGSVAESACGPRVGLERVLSLLLHHALVWKIGIRRDAGIAIARQKLRSGMLLRAQGRLVHCRANKRLLVLQQAVFHCKWLRTLWRLNHLFHLILPLIEIADKFLVAWDSILLRLGILDALHLLLRR